ncbi:trans-1,2-dihydrobenzene-1,2-diol dehydrogenase-like [Artemia franciscana]|uniref:Trans-1,2-dihydrobenzene-1,2-diol dehydrogenase n=1 Tax=Artemia franciscana TaxID=6661 RepID=A0AA88H703_ARTSF|nr:hypothetical protein QYM36_016933 [Artemia franciscana]
MKLRWGIISAGKISQDFCAALQLLSKEDHEIIAIAARNLDDAKSLGLQYSVKYCYSDYKEVAQNPEVDAVYIGSINTTHYELARMMLEHGKPVLCEKPLCLNLKQTEALCEFAKKNKVFLMEALWVRLFPAMLHLRKELDNKTVGEVSQVIVSFGVQIQHVERVKKKQLGGGATLDIGIYCAQLASFAYGSETPLKIVTTGHLNEFGVDESSTSVLTYSGNRTATLIMSTKVDLPNEGLIIGDKGTIKVPFRFWCPTAIVTPDKRYDFPLPPSDHKYNFHNSNGLCYEAEHVRQCLNEGLIESPVVPHSETLLLAKILESIRSQVGVHYPEDDKEY